MRSLAHKKVSWVSPVRKISYSQMSSTVQISQAVAESLSLRDGEQQKRCCCGLFRLYGSDGAWAWLVAFANFLVNFIIVGLGRMSGILYVEFMDLFHIDRKTASVPFSIQQAARNLFGSVAGILGQKYGLRAVTILGGIIGTLSAVIPYFQMNMISVTLLWGLMFGISTALTTTLNQVSIDQYFERHRATAGGFAFSGGCLGAFFFPVVLETLLSHYGMKGTFLVMGTIILHVIPAAIMLVEPPWKHSEATEETFSKNITKYGAFNIIEPKQSTYLVSKEKITDQLSETQKLKPSGIYIDFAILETNSDMVYQFLTMETPDEFFGTKENQKILQKLDKNLLLSELECLYSRTAESRYSNTEVISSISASSVSQMREQKNGESVVRSQRETFSAVWPKEFSRDSSCLTEKESDNEPRVYIENKLKELYEIRGTRLVAHFPEPQQRKAYKILIELRKLREKLTEESEFEAVYHKPKLFVPSIPEGDEKEESEIKLSFSTTSSNSCWNHIKTAFRLHGNPLFLLICLCRGVFMLTFIPVVTIIVDFGMDKGLSKYDGKYIIAALSLGDFIGRLGLGWVTDRGFLSLPRYMVVAMILLGGSSASIPFMHSRMSILVSVLFFAVLQGSLFVRHPLLVSHYVKCHEKSIGMGFINFLAGFLGFALPAFIGYFRDTLGSYDKMFYVNGMICVAVGLLWLLEPFFIRVSSKIPVKS